MQSLKRLLIALHVLPVYHNNTNVDNSKYSAEDTEIVLSLEVCNINNVSFSLQNCGKCPAQVPKVQSSKRLF